MKNTRLLTIIGARPQFVKAAPVSHALREVATALTEDIVHTGQHHDQNMSEVFFEELGIPARQSGWMSQSGEQIPLSISGSGEFLCKKSTKRYILEGGSLKAGNIRPRLGK